MSEDQAQPTVTEAQAAQTPPEAQARPHGIMHSIGKSPLRVAILAVVLYALFELSLTNVNDYDNPFADVELTGRFIHKPSGEVIDFPGFHDGDGAGGQRGRVWRQRFMPTRPGRWDYEITFSDGSPGARGVPARITGVSGTQLTAILASSAKSTQAA